MVYTSFPLIFILLLQLDFHRHPAITSQAEVSGNLPADALLTVKSNVPLYFSVPVMTKYLTGNYHYTITPGLRLYQNPVYW